MIAFDGDASWNQDSISTMDTFGSAIISDGVNPDNNIANSTISLAGIITPYLNNSSIDRATNTFGVDVDRISLVNAISKEVEYSDVIPSAYGDSYYIAGQAFAIEITSPDLVLTKTVDSITGADPVLTEAGDTIVYTVEIENVGQANGGEAIAPDGQQGAMGGPEGASQQPQELGATGTGGGNIGTGNVPVAGESEFSGTVGATGQAG